MRHLLYSTLLLLGFTGGVLAQTGAVSDFPVKAFAIESPVSRNLDSFILFIQKELVPRRVNTLILRVDYHYAYKSHPELVDTSFLTNGEARRLSAAATAGGITIIPQINLLGHQSWAGYTGKLLQVYPQFDETPWVKMPVKYEWPNADSLYCKSYCPLHPDVHKIVFALVDEICEVFNDSSFHAGMDEVFYLGDAKCPRCRARDKSQLFAGEVQKIRDHLATKNRKLWIWGDRLLDGKTTGIGGWEASFNDTHRAIDMIPRDVVICDWHYERPDKTAVYFAAKGLQVITCTWNRPAVAVEQVRDMVRFRNQSTPEMRDRFLGVMQTVWSPASQYLKGYQKDSTFNAMFSEVNK